MDNFYDLPEDFQDSYHDELERDHDEPYEHEAGDFEDDDGQPTEYQEWQDYMGGEDFDQGQYDTEY